MHQAEDKAVSYDESRSILLAALTRSSAELLELTRKEDPHGEVLRNSVEVLDEYLHYLEELRGVAMLARDRLLAVVRVLAEKD